jgi:glycosyltransferase involved in cell wall biosynthesis
VTTTRNGRGIGVFVDPAVRSSAGIERYLRELLDAISDSEWADNCTLFSSQPDAARAVLAGRPAERLELLACRVPPRLVRYAWAAGAPRLERLIGREFGLVHSPAHQRIPAAVPYVATIHDVGFSKHPASMTTRQRWVLSRHLERQAVRHAAHLITVSESTRRDVVELFGVPEDRTTVVHLGVDHDRFRPAKEDEVAVARKRYGLTAPYVLYVGSLYQRKVGNLLEAFAVVAGRNADIRLVVVGGRENSPPWQRLAAKARGLGLTDRIVLTGPVPDAEVAALMSGAAVFTYVSFFEGFGLSPLEAMACGTPVVVSNRASLPEVVADAGSLVDPDDPSEIADAILEPLEDAGVRERMATASIARAALFTWPRMARETLAVYDRCMNG